jgi:molecular chaperone DnaK
MWLRGEDLDNAVAKYVTDEFQKENGIDLSNDPQAMTRVIEAVEKAKIELSGTANSEINLPYITANQNGPLHLVFNLTKAKFEQIIKPFIDRLIGCAKKAVELAKIDKTDLNGIVLVGGSCRIPYVQKRLEEEFGCKLIKSADLDLAVAQGAAIQANILAGNTDGPGSDILLLDVTPLSIGIETMGGVMTKMVEANTTIPTHKEETFSTAENNQSMVMINVLQGERPMAADNKSLGQFMLDGIMPAPRGVPQIVVSFDVDANGILNVSAKDKATGKEQHITITGQSGLSKDEIERIKAEAEAHKSEDEKKQAEIQKLNQCESFAYGIENTLKEAGDKITEDEKNTVQPKLDALNEAIKTRNADEAEKLMKDVQDAFAPIATRLYQAGQQAQAQSEQTAQDTSSPSDQVQDADFEEVK